MRFGVFVAGALAAGCFAVPANAAIVPYSVTIDSTKFGHNPSMTAGKSTISYSAQPFGVSSFTLSPGDTLVGTVNILNGPVIVQDSGAGFERVDFGAQAYGYNLYWRGKFSFGGVSGNYVGASQYLSSYELPYYFNSSVEPEAYGNLTNSWFSFTSISFEITLTMAARPETFYFPTVHVYDQPTPPPPPVPEPATWLTMLLGFGAIGGALRRRSTATARARLA